MPKGKFSRPMNRSMKKEGGWAALSRHRRKNWTRVESAIYGERAGKTLFGKPKITDGGLSSIARNAKKRERIKRKK